MTTLSAYLQTRRLKLSHAKMVTAAFHLHNREVKRELKVKNNGKILPFFAVPTYLGVKLDRAPTYRHHLEALRKKLFTRVSLLGDLRVQDGMLVPRHCAQQPCPCSIRLLSTVHQLGVAARILASLTAFLMTLCALSLDAYVPLQRTTFQFSQASSQLSFAAEERHSPWLIAVLWTLPTFFMAS